MPLEIKDRERLQAVLGEMLPDIVAANPQVVLDAFAKNPEALRKSLADSGVIVSGPAVPRPQDVIDAYNKASDEGRVIRGFGSYVRKRCQSRQYTDPATGRTRRTYLWGEAEELSHAWFRAFLNKDGFTDNQAGSPTFGKRIGEIRDLIDKATRAPSTPMTAEAGTGGGFLVPQNVAAEIFEETVERFVLRSLVEVFTSAAPLRIPRRTAQITVSRGAPSTQLVEKDGGSLLGYLNLSPERVGALAYIDPQLALAAAVGPIRWIIAQFAEAMAKEYQRVIVAGDRTIREPWGINTLPTSGQNTYDLAKTATWTDTSLQTQRDSVRQLMFKIVQYHRESARFVFIGNADMARKLASTNDMNQRPWKDPTASGMEPGSIGGAPGATYYGKQFVETTALSTVSNATSLLCGDMAQYAWLEAPDGLRMEQTNVGGQAWESDSIGVKVVQSYDGGPVTPVTFGIMSSIPV